jgi:hypothetical protein
MMNERIRELAEQVGFGWDDKYHWYVGSRQMEKFAELIIEESIKVMKENDYHADWLGEKIKQHFGVEE